ncbi:MAG: hypothetical protein A3F84_11220 [Candidatus Handelsmanbacteria bacterium RIFCSPLOWO2_12_FULL_64_10]|uniref:Phosphoglycerate mutase n=1 Tax=Handelsmanbacteria sp. (strain RIFCSPLOWO2_12_FULL_64_10) TaxID=1817868 RepID=A0A1F6C760_HANXR|nr:MAG: hypothetical protein A3F84_11220 [Candidatus Handelsmanbacteria bacterium RIFCSPLOWO2_12_FULL_64_10]
MRLSQQGREDVQRTARLLSLLRVDAVYTSPLLPARQSAQILAHGHSGIEIRKLAWLVEVRTSWQGEPRSAQDTIENFSYYNPLRGEGDETIQDVFDRMDRALRYVAKRHPGQTVICVSHGDPIKILGLPYSGKDLTHESMLAPDPPEASVAAFQFLEEKAPPVLDLWIPRAVIRPRIVPRGQQQPAPAPTSA